MNAESVCSWQVASDAIDRIRYWEDEERAVFYCFSSGDTYVLDGIAVDLYHLLLGRPLTEAQILQALADAIEPGAEAEFAQQLRSYLERYSQIGLLHESTV